MSPKLSENENVEMKNIPVSAADPNPDDDIMQFARLGNVAAVEKLFESGKFSATYCDGEGITPLHVSQHM